jgi:hypothetical protein
MHQILRKANLILNLITTGIGIRYIRKSSDQAKIVQNG